MPGTCCCFVIYKINSVSLDDFLSLFSFCFLKLPQLSDIFERIDMFFFSTSVVIGQGILSLCCTKNGVHLTVGPDAHFTTYYNKAEYFKENVFTRNLVFRLLEQFYLEGATIFGLAFLFIVIWETLYLVLYFTLLFRHITKQNIKFACLLKLNAPIAMLFSKIPQTAEEAFFLLLFHA